MPRRSARARPAGGNRSHGIAGTRARWRRSGAADEWPASSRGTAGKDAQKASSLDILATARRTLSASCRLRFACNLPSPECRRAARSRCHCRERIATRAVPATAAQPPSCSGRSRCWTTRQCGGRQADVFGFGVGRGPHGLVALAALARPWRQSAAAMRDRRRRHADRAQAGTHQRPGCAAHGPDARTCRDAAFRRASVDSPCPSRGRLHYAVQTRRIRPHPSCETS